MSTRTLACPHTGRTNPCGNAVDDDADAKSVSPVLAASGSADAVATAPENVVMIAHSSGMSPRMRPGLSDQLNGLLESEVDVSARQRAGDGDTRARLHETSATSGVRPHASISSTNARPLGSVE